MEFPVDGPVRVHIRWMIRRDMPEVLAIEHASSAFPWGENEFLGWLRMRTVIGMVAEVSGGVVVGFVIYELTKASVVVRNLAVHPDWHRRGVGRQLSGKVESKLSSHRRTIALIDVRESNLTAHMWLRSCGWSAVDVLWGHCGDTGEDAYRFELSFDPLSRPGTRREIAWGGRE